MVELHCGLLGIETESYMENYTSHLSLSGFVIYSFGHIFAFEKEGPSNYFISS